MKRILCNTNGTSNYQIFFYSLMTHSDRVLRELARMCGSPIKKVKVDTAHALALHLSKSKATATITIKSP